MHEETPNAFEEEQWAIPTPEEVQGIFEQLEIGEYETVRQLEDEQGLYLWGIVVSKKNQNTDNFFI